MNQDTLSIIIDEIFSVLETATEGKPIAHTIVGIVHALAKQLVPVILNVLKAKGVA